MGVRNDGGKLLSITLLLVVLFGGIIIENFFFNRFSISVCVDLTK